MSHGKFHIIKQEMPGWKLTSLTLINYIGWIIVNSSLRDSLFLGTWHQENINGVAFIKARKLSMQLKVYQWLMIVLWLSKSVPSSSRSQLSKPMPQQLPVKEERLKEPKCLTGQRKLEELKFFYSRIKKDDTYTTSLLFFQKISHEVMDSARKA